MNFSVIRGDEMDDIEKLKAAKELWRVYWENVHDSNDKDDNWENYLDSEIARLEDPHAKAKRVIVSILSGDSLDYMIHHDERQPLGNYIRHIEGELVHYKIQYQHAKEAMRPVASEYIGEVAVEPLDPNRVLATAAKLISDRYSDGGGFLNLDRAMAHAICWGISENAKPYEVQE